DIIVATPGRMLDHLDRGSVRLDRLEVLILDEADRMLDMGFSEDMEKIVSRAPEGRQTLMFTATMENSVLKLAEKMLRNPLKIELAVRTSSIPLIEQRLHVADSLHHKKELLHHLISDHKLTRAIIFSATKRDADDLARELSKSGHQAATLHGDMNQMARNKTIERMRRGAIRLLVATDVAARGLDVNGVSHVINFDLPRFAEDYVHRIGRTGRAGAAGIAISFVSNSELCYLERIERFIGKKLPEQNIEGLAPLSVLRRIASSSGPRHQPGAAGGRFGKPGIKANTSQRQGKPWDKSPKPGSGRDGQEKKWDKPARSTSRPRIADRRDPVIEYRSRRPQL
ncbi:MAG: DEAD/DEAH box helicase, partial [Deltaproteobacteria bacterium]